VRHVVKQLTLLTTAFGGVDPKPSTVAPSRRARWHVGGDLEICEPSPYTGLVHAKNGKVLGLDSRDIGLVGNGKSASGEILKVLEQSQMIDSCGKARRETDFSCNKDELTDQTRIFVYI